MAGTRPAGAAAAWPVGQAVSRFVSGPPAAGARPGDGRPADPRATGAAPAARSAAGSPYDEPPLRGARSPSGTPYDEPARVRPAAEVEAGYNPADRYGRDAGYDPRAGYGQDSGYGSAGYDPDPLGGGYSGRAYSEPAYPEPAYPDPASYGGGDSYAGRGYSRHGGGWTPDDHLSGWPSDGQQHGWPQDHQQPGSPPHDEHGWPSDHSATTGAADRAWYPPGQETWSDQPGLDGGLEALPPAEEVHHDWSDRRDRAARGWSAPGEDEEGEAW